MIEHYLYIIIGRDLTRQSDRPYLVQSGYGGELQAKLIEVCGLPTVQLQLQHALQPSIAVATYDPAIISITPAAGKADLVPACMFTLQHVDCVGTHRLSLAYTQAISTVLLYVVVSTRVGRQKALGLE